MRLETKKYLLFVIISSAVATLWGQRDSLDQVENEDITCTFRIENNTKYDLDIYVQTKAEEVFKLAPGASKSATVEVNVSTIPKKKLAMDLRVNKLTGMLEGETVTFKEENIEKPLRWGWTMIAGGGSIDINPPMASQSFIIGDNSQQFILISWVQNMSKKTIDVNIIEIDHTSEFFQGSRCNLQILQPKPEVSQHR